MAVGFGNVVTKSGSYAVVTGDSGNILAFSGSGLTATLPAAAPTEPWMVTLVNYADSPLAVSPNGLTLNGASGDITLGQNQSVIVWSDSHNYWYGVGTTSLQGNTVSVVGYGADYTGAADSTAAIENALSALVALGGGELLFPAGTYKHGQVAVTSTVAITIRYEGCTVEPNGSTVAAADNGLALSALGTLTLAATASTAGFLSSGGGGYIVASDGAHSFTYTGISGATLTGCVYAGNNAATVATGNHVGAVAEGLWYLNGAGNAMFKGEVVASGNSVVPHFINFASTTNCGMSLRLSATTAAGGGDFADAVIYSYQSTDLDVEGPFYSDNSNGPTNPSNTTDTASAVYCDGGIRNRFADIHHSGGQNSPHVAGFRVNSSAAAMRDLVVERVTVEGTSTSPTLSNETHTAIVIESHSVETPLRSNCNVTAGSNVITTSGSFAGILPGAAVGDITVGAGYIPAGAVVTSLNSDTSVTISADATGGPMMDSVTFLQPYLLQNVVIRDCMTSYWSSDAIDLINVQGVVEGFFALGSGTVSIISTGLTLQGCFAVHGRGPGFVVGDGASVGPCFNVILDSCQAIGCGQNIVPGTNNAWDSCGFLVIGNNSAPTGCGPNNVTMANCQSWDDNASAPFITAVAAADNGSALSALSTLTLTTTTGLGYGSGQGTIVASDGTHTFTYTGVSGSTLTGCVYSGSLTATVSTNNLVVVGPGNQQVGFVVWDYADRVFIQDCYADLPLSQASTTLGSWPPTGPGVWIYGSPSTTVAAADNGLALSALSTLTVASTSQVPSNGAGTIVASDGTHKFTYTGVSGSTLTGCVYLGINAATVATGNLVVIFMSMIVKVRGVWSYNPRGQILTRSGQPFAVPPSGFTAGNIDTDSTVYVTAAAGGPTTIVLIAATITVPANQLASIFVPAGKSLTVSYGAGNAPSWEVVSS